MNRITLLLVFALIHLASCQNSQKPTPQASHQDAETVIAKPANIRFGMDLDTFDIQQGEIQKNEFMASILGRYNVDYTTVDELVRNSLDTFDVRKIRPGKKYWVLSESDSANATPEFFIYEKDRMEYVVFCMGDSCYAYTGEHPTEVVTRTVSGVINSSLYQSLDDVGMGPALGLELAEIYAWTVDFYRIQKGDHFTVLFEEQLVDGESVGIKSILSADFNHSGESLQSYYYTQDSIGDYFDETGNSLKKAFLKAPLQFSRISSRYSKKRFHPVLKRNKAHLGTDYAAPSGTPILAVGDGVVSHSQYKSNNGNYVKIRHNSTYETQYLHMSKRNCKVGDHVRQGDVIGYVGSTGLATGPHVCFRFWKNGQQVDHLREKFPPSIPINEENKVDFEATKVLFQSMSDSLAVPVEPTPNI
ncbi:MAG: murein DD-endopeptidase MepM/ murein hydrolase activator NlpD [Flavobacteriales bacterium]|jgi:murein DD-endopeptidase MepM/ murein hydrolase activator NlpD